MARRHLIDLSDDELKELLRQIEVHTSHGYNSIVAELDRRAANRQAQETRILSIVSIGIALVALFVSALGGR